MSEAAFLEGVISVMAALQAGNRPIRAVYMRQGKWGSPRTRGWQRLRRTAESQHIPVQFVTEEFLQEKVSGNSHGGVIAEVETRRFVTMDELVTGRERPFIVMLDGLEDPFNFGQAIRALYAAGVDGLVLRPRNWLSAAGIVVRASAGASEWMPTALAESAEAAAAFYRQRGLQIACTTQAEATSIYEADLRQPMFLLVGGERRGITRSLLDQAELRLQIPYGRPFSHSLGAAASAAIVAFEMMRQRRSG
jgi:23S rRNA (guanosine2251-2'-O)-methyltransferase